VIWFVFLKQWLVFVTGRTGFVKKQNHKYGPGFTRFFNHCRRRHEHRGTKRRSWGSAMLRSGRLAAGFLIPACDNSHPMSDGQLGTALPGVTIKRCCCGCSCVIRSTRLSNECWWEETFQICLVRNLYWLFYFCRLASHLKPFFYKLAGWRTSLTLIIAATVHT
jgi:hypothetical protein